MPTQEKRDILNRHVAAVLERHRFVAHTGGTPLVAIHSGPEASSGGHYGALPDEAYPLNSLYELHGRSRFFRYITIKTR